MLNVTTTGLPISTAASKLTAYISGIGFAALVINASSSGVAPVLLAVAGAREPIAGVEETSFTSVVAVASPVVPSGYASVTVKSHNPARSYTTCVVNMPPPTGHRRNVAAGAV